MLPLVHSITEDIVRVSNDVVQTRERLNYLMDGRGPGQTNDVYGKELASIEKHTDQVSETLNDYYVELNNLGLKSERVTKGYVDFPALRLNERVCLCWKLGESEVKYWHGIDEVCSQRRTVDLELIRQSGELSLSESS